MAWHISPGQSFVVLRFPNRSLGFYACHIRKHPIILMWLGHSLYHNFSLSDLRTLTDPYLGQFYHPQMRHHFQSNINVNSIKSPSEYANSLSKKLRVLFDLTFRVSCLYLSFGSVLLHLIREKKWTKYSVDLLVRFVVANLNVKIDCLLVINSSVSQSQFFYQTLY